MRTPASCTAVLTPRRRPAVAQSWVKGSENYACSLSAWSALTYSKAPAKPKNKNMARIKRAQCLVCCKMYDTREEADACTHEADEPDMPAALTIVSPVAGIAWGLGSRAKKRRKADLDAAPPPTATPPVPEPDPAEQLRKLAELHRDGLLTDEEFAAKRAVIVEKL